MKNNMRQILSRSLFALGAAVCFVGAAISGVTMAPMEAQAQDTDKITMDFVGFGVNPDFYAIVQGSQLAGKSLVIYKVGGQGPVLVYPLKGVSLDKALASKEVAPYGIRGGHHEGMVSPVGWQLGGMVIGENLQLTLSAGGQSMTLGYAALFTSPSKKKVAAVSIKSAYWTPDSKKLVIILNQKLDGDWSMDSDMVAAYTLG